MSAGDTCSRVWQAHAIEDGRLVGLERLSFEKHVHGCSVCARELAELAELRATMLRIPPPLASAPLEHRRRRAELLRRANARALARADQRFWRRGAWLAAAVSCVGVALVVLAMFGRRRVAQDGADTPTSPPAFEVDDAEGAAWTSEVHGATVQARLAAGTASFHVARTHAGQRFFLQLPDGQIEVHGTRFRVDVRDGVTKRVEVSEGVVTLRLRGELEHTLRAGETWDGVTGPEFSRDARAETAHDDGARASPVETSASERSAPADAGLSAHARSGSSRPDIFAAAVTAFRGGNYRRAEQLLDRFLDDSPRDARAEDARFMKAVARSRSGDAEGAAKLAQEYLARFPQGLRRREAERIVAEWRASDAR